MLGRGHRLTGQGVALFKLGQTPALLAVAIGRVVEAFLVDRQEAVEQHDGAVGAEPCDVLAARPVDGDVDRDLLEARALHLAGQRALPDQLVEPARVGLQGSREMFRPARGIGRPDRLVGLLGVLGLGLVDPGRRGQVGVAEAVEHDLAHAGQSFPGDLNAVGPHVGDQADGLAAQVDALVELLGDPHGPGRAEAQLARRLLLQRGGGEGRVGIAPGLLALDLLDSETGSRFQDLDRVVRGRLVAQVELVELLAAQMGQPGGEVGLGRVLQPDVDGPVLLGLEDLDLGLALADQPQGHRLHPAGRAAAGQLAPQDRRQREADQVVQRAAGQIGVDQLAVQLPRLLEGVDHRGLGDLVEDDALDRDAGQRSAPLELLGDMP